MGHIWTQLLQELVTPVSPAVKFENFLTETLKKDRREDHSSIKCFLTYTLKYFPIHSSVYLFLCMYMFTWRGGMCVSCTHTEASVQELALSFHHVALGIKSRLSDSMARTPTC